MRTSTLVREDAREVTPDLAAQFRNALRRLIDEGESLPTVTGRFRGYTTEVDTVGRLATEFAEKRGYVLFTMTDTKVIGSAGFFTRRTISKTEYTIVGATDAAVEQMLTAVQKLCNIVLS